MPGLSRTLALVSVVSLLSASSVALAVPLKTPLQGVIQDNAGQPVADGAFSVTFALYPSADDVDPVWSEAWPPGGADCLADPTGCVNVSGGLFTVDLGTHAPLEPTLFAAGELWLGVSVEGEPELSRRPLGSAPYAIYAATAGGLDCTGCIAPEALPGDGLDDVSNGLMTTQFEDVFSSSAPLEIKDYYPPGASDVLFVADVGIAQALRVSVTLVNSDIATLLVTLTDPDGVEFVLHDLSGAGDTLDTTWPDPTPLVSGDLAGTWHGRNPAGPWTLSVVDSGFLDTPVDGQVSAWSISVDTLSTQKVAVKGDLIVEGTISGPGGIVVGEGGAACGPDRAGALSYDPATKRLWFCDGDKMLQLRACAPDCPPVEEVSCGEPVLDGCGEPCGGTGLATNTVQCLSKVSTTPCGVSVADGCDNDCGILGTALSVPGCPLPEEVGCGEVISDACGNVCQGVGTSCGDGEVCYDGGCAGPGEAPTNPAESCSHVALGGADTDGMYTIDPDGDGPTPTFQAWCDLPAGWTLAMRMGPDDVLGYASPLWTNTTLYDDDPLGSGQPGVEATAKFAASVHLAATELRGCKGEATGCLEMGLGGTMTLVNRMSGGGVDGSFSRSQFVSLFGDDASQPHCNKNGINQTWTYAGYRFGHVGNNENDCNSTDSAWGWGVYGASNTSKTCGCGLAPHTAGVSCVHGTLWVR